MVSEKSYSSWYFMGFAILSLIVLLLIFPERSSEVFSKILSIFKSLIPTFVVIFLIFVIMNLFITNKFLLKHMGKSAGIGAWFFSVFAGILSAGPIYAWYPLLSDLQDKGVRTAFIVTFLYNRAIKLPLLPLLIAYFSFKFAIVLLVVMLFVSILQGLVVERILKKLSSKK